MCFFMLIQTSEARFFFVRKGFDSTQMYNIQILSSLSLSLTFSKRFHVMSVSEHGVVTEKESYRLLWLSARGALRMRIW